MIPRASELVAEWRKLEAKGEVEIHYIEGSYVVMDAQGHVAVFLDDDDDGFSVVITDKGAGGGASLVEEFVLDRFGGQ